MYTCARAPIVLLLGVVLPAALVSCAETAGHEGPSSPVLPEPRPDETYGDVYLAFVAAGSPLVPTERHPRPALSVSYRTSRKAETGSPSLSDAVESVATSIVLVRAVPDRIMFEQVPPFSFDETLDLARLPARLPGEIVSKGAAHARLRYRTVEVYFGPGAVTFADDVALEEGHRRMTLAAGRPYPLTLEGDGLSAVEIPVSFEADPEEDLILVVGCDLAASLETLRVTDDGLRMRPHLEVVAYLEDRTSEFTGGVN